MDMNWLESIIYGLLSGLTEFLPVSAQAHKAIALHLFGAGEKMPLMELFIHIGVLVGLYFSTRDYLRRLGRERQLQQRSRRRRRPTGDRQSAADMALTKTACIPLVLSYFFYSTTSAWGDRLYIVALFLLLNGIILHIPMYLPTGNKDSRSMSRLDGLLMGVLSMSGILPGISTVGVVSSTAIGRGAAPQQAFRWSLLLCYPVLLIMLGFDLYGIFSVGLAGLGFVLFLQCLAASVAACLGAVLSIALVKAIVLRTGISSISYYCFGTALFAFILYLI